MKMSLERFECPHFFQVGDASETRAANISQMVRRSSENHTGSLHKAHIHTTATDTCLVMNVTFAYLQLIH